MKRIVSSFLRKAALSGAVAAGSLAGPLSVTPAHAQGTVTGASAPASIKGIMNPIKFEEYTLPNGLHVILYEEHSAPIAAVRLYYHVGSKNEDPQRTGFAHFFEHLMFESTRNIKRGEFGKNIETAGGQLNAWTSLDQTVYVNDVPSNQLEMVLWQEAERMHYLKVDSVGVETQRQVVKEERRNRYENQPYGTFFLQMMKNVMTGTPYEWTPIGDAQYIDQATVAEFEQFYRTYYVPNNATLVIAGDFKPAAVKKMIEAYFGPIPRGANITRPTFSVSSQTAEKFAEVNEPHTPLPAIVYAWRTVKEGVTDAYAFDLLQKVLTSGNSSRLVKRLKDQDKVAIELSAIPLSAENGGIFGVLAIAGQGQSVDAVRSALDDELAKIQNNGITQEEYEKVMNQITKDIVSSAASMGDVAFKLAHYHAVHGDASMVNRELEAYRKITKQDIQRVAQQYLNNNNRTVLIYTVPKS
jgi:zinc protease